MHGKPTVLLFVPERKNSTDQLESETEPRYPGKTTIDSEAFKVSNSNETGKKE